MQYLICFVLGCINVLVKLWVFNSDEIITRAKFIELKSYIVGLMNVYMFGKLFSTPLDIQCMIIFDQLNELTRAVLHNYGKANGDLKAANLKGMIMTDGTKEQVKKAHLEMNKV
jgi:hypothetical protein